MICDGVVALGEKGREKGRGRGWTVVVLSGSTCHTALRHPAPRQAVTAVVVTAKGVCVSVPQTLAAIATGDTVATTETLQ